MSWGLFRALWLRCLVCRLCSAWTWFSGHSVPGLNAVMVVRAIGNDGFINREIALERENEGTHQRRRCFLQVLSHYLLLTFCSCHESANRCNNIELCPQWLTTDTFLSPFNTLKFTQQGQTSATFRAVSECQEYVCLEEV